MAVRGITFAKQTVSSNDDAHIYKVLLQGRNGRTKGCNMTYGTDDIYISEGYFFAGNRLIEIPSTETVSTPIVTSGTTYCRLVFEVDLSKINTNEAFTQGYFKILTASGDYPSITQEDVDNGGNIYQLPFARFTKTISGIGSFISELETIGSMPEDLTVYVSPYGNNASGDGSFGAPYKTIQHALNSIPKNLEGKDIIIKIASGTYAEEVVVSGFHGGAIRFECETVTVTTFTVYDPCVIIAGTSLTLAANGKTYGFYVHRGANVICQIPLTVNGAVNGVFAGYGSRFSGRNIITLNSCTNAVVASYASHVYAIELTGSKNNNAVQAAAGIASIGTISSSMASTLYITVAGGRIYTGSQANVPTY